jgi:hypothetical protein
MARNKMHTAEAEIEQDAQEQLRQELDVESVNEVSEWVAEDGEELQELEPSAVAAASGAGPEAEADATPETESKPVVETKTAKIVALHAAGMKVGAISKTLKLSYQQCYNTLRSKGLIHPRTEEAKADSVSNKIRRLHKAGLTCGAIAKELGIPYQHAYNVLKGQIHKVNEGVSAAGSS